MRVALHLSSVKTPQAAILAALSEAMTACGDSPVVASSSPDPDADMGVIFGVAGDSHRLIEAYRDRGFIFIDKGYFGRGLFWRVSPNGPHPTGDFRSDSSAAFERAGARLWDRPFGKACLIPGSSQKAGRFFGVPDMAARHRALAEEASRLWRGAVIYRCKPGRTEEPIPGVDFDPGRLPIDQALQGAGAVLTVVSNAAVDALRWGRPVVVSGPGALSGWVPSEVTRESLTTPIPRPLRDRLLWGLAEHQWTIREMALPQTWRRIRDQVRASAGIHRVRPQGA